MAKKSKNRKIDEAAPLIAGLPSLVELDRELISRGGLYEFVQMAWPHVDPATHVSERHELEVCKHLEALASGEIKNLCINIPPAMSKSLLCCVFLPAWSWTFNPALKWGFASYDLALVRRDARRCRALIESKWYQDRWPLKLMDDSNKIDEYTNEHKGYRLSVTIRGGLTGKHVDIAVIDDPHKPLAFEIGEGKKESELVRDWYDGTLPTRFTDPRNARKLLVMQRLSDDDLTAHVLSGGETYEHLCLPMEFDPLNVCKTSIGGDWRKEAGELLAPERFTREVVENLKATFRSPRIAAAQLQQNPIPREGSTFKEGWTRKRYKKLPEKGLQIFHSWDCAFKDAETSDYVAGQVWAMHGDDFYLVDQVRGKWDFVETCRQIESLIRQYPKYIGLIVEDKANGSAIISYLKHSRNVSRIVPVNPSGGKEARANAAAPLFETGHVYLPEDAPWLSDYLSELLAFPAGKHDDQVDATTQALNYFTQSTNRNIIRAFENIRRGKVSLTML